MLSNTLSRIHGSLLLNPTRPSALFNEDDFDYAIELLPDDEYRQVAEMLPDVIDFDDVDFAAYEHDNDNLNNNEENGPVEPGLSLQQLQRMSIALNARKQKEYDLRITGLGTQDHPGRGIGIQVVSKDEFRRSMNKLREDRKSIEIASRRSSVGFQKYFPFHSEKEAMDKFLLLMARGTTVTRHQSFKYAEKVVLLSSTGCRTIEWEKPGSSSSHSNAGAREIRVKKKRKGLMKFWCTRRLFDVCGFVSEWCTRPVQDNSDEINEHANSDHPSNQNNRLRTLRPINSFWNAGFKRSGLLKDMDIVAVVAASQPDPDDASQLGTESIRASREAFNAELTFSVLYEEDSLLATNTGMTNTHSHGYRVSLDLECESYEQYFVLITGFHMLKKEVLAKKAAKGENCSHHYQSTDGNTPPETCWSCLVRTWTNANSQLRAQKTQQETVDPASHLFAPAQSIDPLKTFQNHRRALSPFILQKQPTKTNKLLQSSPTSSANSKSNNNTNINTNNIGNSNNDSHNVAAISPRLPIAQFLGWSSAGTQIWARLKMAGLEVKVSFGWDLRSVILKVRCPKWRLEQMAQQMHLKLRTRDGRLRPFRVSRRDSFQAYGVGGNIFRSSERQQIIDYILRSKIQDGGAELDEHTELGRFIVQRFPLHMYSRLIDIRRTWVTFWKQEKPGDIAEAWSPFSSSYYITYQKLTSSVNYFFDHLLVQPIDSIAEYFGENIAFYFAFLSFYTRWLVIPSILGVIVFIVQMTSHRFDHWLCAPYAIILMVWICLMLVYWRQKESSLAHRWGVLDYEVEETERPQFRGETYLDESTNEWRKYYPGWKRLLRYFLSIPIVLCAVLVTLVVMTTVFYSQHQVYNQYKQGQSLSFSPSFPSFHDITHGNWTTQTSSSSAGASSNGGAGDRISLAELENSDFWAATFFYPCLYGMLTSLMTLAFDWLAVMLNEFENHKTQTTFMNRLILKVFSFQFVAIFTSLYYYAFFIKSQEAAFSRIAVTIFSFMTVGQWWSVFLDVCLPSLYHRALVYEMKARVANINRRIFAVKEISEKAEQDIEKAQETDKEKAEKVKEEALFLQEKLTKRVRYLDQARSPCWEEALQSKYNTFNDYTDLVIQLSFILFFGAIFPLAPLLALLNNLALIRCHAFKLCHTRQRPIAQKTGGIGVWSDVLQILSVGGALTNCALFGFVSTPVRQYLLPRVGQSGIALLLFGYEQVLLLFKYWLHTSVPKIPPSVQRAQLRERKSLSRKSFERAKQRLIQKQQQQPSKKNNNNNNNNFGAYPQQNTNNPDSVNNANNINKTKNSNKDNNEKKSRKKSSLFNWLTGVEDWADELALPPLPQALPPRVQKPFQKMNYENHDSWSPLSQNNNDNNSPYSMVRDDDADLEAEGVDNFANGALVSRQPFAPLTNNNNCNNVKQKKKDNLADEIENYRPQINNLSNNSGKKSNNIINNNVVKDMLLFETGELQPHLSEYFAFGDDYDDDEDDDDHHEYKTCIDLNNNHNNRNYYDYNEYDDEGEDKPPSEEDYGGEEEEELNPVDYGAVEIDGAIMDNEQDDYDNQDFNHEEDEDYLPPPDEEYEDECYDYDEYNNNNNIHNSIYVNSNEHDNDNEESDAIKDDCSEITFHDFDDMTLQDMLLMAEEEQAQPFSAHYLYSSGLLFPPNNNSNTNTNNSTNQKQNLSQAQKYALKHAQLRQLQQNLQKRRIQQQQSQHQRHINHRMSVKKTANLSNNNSPIISHSNKTSPILQKRTSHTANNNVNKNKKRVSNMMDKPWMMPLTAAALPHYPSKHHNLTNMNIASNNNVEIHQYRRGSNVSRQMPHLAPLHTFNTAKSPARRASVSPPRAPPSTNNSISNNVVSALKKSKPLVLLTSYNPQTDSPFNYTQDPQSHVFPPRSPKSPKSNSQTNNTNAVHNNSPRRVSQTVSHATPNNNRNHTPLTTTLTNSQPASFSSPMRNTRNIINNNNNINPFSFASPASASRPTRINFD